MDFDFISDEQFRLSLANDYREMKSCEEAGSWKAIHVLAGSIIEALLIEYLVVSKIRPKGKDPLKLDLNEAIQACEDAGVILKTTSSLCDVIRDYRNLIHAGRAIRLQQPVTPEGAHIAINLVTLITKEVAERRKANYGPTAAQIVKKINIDQHSLAVLPQLLSETNEHELMKLVDSLIPEAYTQEESYFPDEEILSRLRITYRQALDLLTVTAQTKIAERFARSVREDSTDKIQNYCDAFFSAKDIAYLQKKDAEIVIKHLLTRLEEPTPALSQAFMITLAGLGKVIPIAELNKFGDTLVKLVLRQSEKSLGRVMEFIEQEFDNLELERQQLLEKRISHWVEFGKKKGYPEGPQFRLEAIAGKWWAIPF